MTGSSKQFHYSNIHRISGHRDTVLNVGCGCGGLVTIAGIVLLATYIEAAET